MRNIKTRVEKLEVDADSGRLKPPKLVMLPHDTREATDRRIAKAHAEVEAEGGDVFIFEPVPATDESINDFRGRQGLERMEIDGWDNPSPCSNHKLIASK